MTRSKRDNKDTRNYTAIALQKRHGNGVKVMKDRRERRRDRNSWRKELDV